jgi:hypothetical protein
VRFDQKDRDDRQRDLSQITQPARDTADGAAFFGWRHIGEQRHIRINANVKKQRKQKYRNEDERH